MSGLRFTAFGPGIDLRALEMAGFAWADAHPKL
jgi:hypothetical protein